MKQHRTWKMWRPAVLLTMALVLLMVFAAGCGSENGTTSSSAATTVAPSTAASSSDTTAASKPETTSSSGVSGATQSETASSSTRTIVDMGGNTVTIPATINRIVITCQGGAAQEVAVLGGASKVVGMPPMKMFPTLLKMFPMFKDVPSVGTFDEINVEALLSLKPDVVIASVAAPKGNKAISDAGVPVVTIFTGSNNEASKCEKEFKMIGELLGNTERADQLIAFWEEHLGAVKQRVQAVPVAEQKQVYYALGALTHTNGNAMWGEALMTAAGGVNVAASLEKTKDTDVEQVVKWNPGVMILSSNEGKFQSINDIMANPQLSEVQAVKSKQVYLCPQGAFWWDRPSPEAVLGITWLAKTLYPAQCQDLDLEGLTKEFFKTFYGYDLSTEEFQAFLAPTS